ncbi:MAG TPA: hypothetical protein VME70_03410 [Mycobacteriales bacterium]|nr:hypothetical protein [Mycobacteriales bacterium]
MPTSAALLDPILAAVIAHPAGWSEGALRAVFLDRRSRVLLTVGFDEGTRAVDELYLRHVVATVSDLSVATVVFAVLRADGRPIRIDRLLWRELSMRLAGQPTHPLDLIVVGREQHWSMAQSTPLTSVVARWPDRTAPSG